MMFIASGMIRCTIFSKSAKRKNDAQFQVAQGRATSECWGPVGVGSQLQEAAQFWKVS